jgi:hypothetical protein
MKASLKQFFLLPALIAGLGLMLTGRVTAQTFTFGPQVQTTDSASITYDPVTNTFQYTDAANSSSDFAYLPLSGTAAAFITTSNGWTASLTVNISAGLMTAANGVDPHVSLILGVANSNDLTNYSLGYTLVNVLLGQINNTGGGDNDDFPYGFYGTAAKFGASMNGVEDVTTPLDNSYPNSGGGAYLPLSGGTNDGPVTESISNATGVLTLSYNASTKTVAGYYDATPVASYSLASWGSNPPLTLIVVGGSGKGAGASAGTVTASDFYAGPLPVLAIIPSGTNVILRWPTNNAIGFTLQSTTNLVSTAGWTTVSPAPVVVNGQNAVTNSISSTQKFYRLSLSN